MFRWMLGGVFLASGLFSIQSVTGAGPRMDVDAHWDFANPEATEKKFRELLEQAKEQRNQSYEVELLTQIARTYSLRRKVKEAHALLDQARDLITDAMPRLQVRYLLERGRTFNTAGDKAAAKTLFQEAWTMANQANEEYLAVDVAHMLAIVTREGEALTWNLKALKLAESAEDERARKWLGSLYNNIGYTLMQNKKYPEAIAYFRKGLKLREGENNADGARIFRWFIGKTMRLMGRTREAVKIQLAQHQELDKNGKKSAYNLEELGECYLSLNDTRDAKKYFQAALTEFRENPDYQWVVAEEPERIARLERLVK